MEPLLLPYLPTVLAMGIVGAMLLVQLLVADFAGIIARHPPGTPVAADHDTFLFRAVRAHANTNESIASFILLVLFALSIAADPAWLNGLTAAYAASRVAHMACYYANLKLLRSAVFAISLVAQGGILVLGIVTWLGR